MTVPGDFTATKILVISQNYIELVFSKLIFFARLTWKDKEHKNDKWWVCLIDVFIM